MSVKESSGGASPGASEGISHWSLPASLRVGSMRRGFRRCAAIAAALAACSALPFPARGDPGLDYFIYEAAASHSPMTGACIGSAPDDVTVVAWRDAQGDVWTRAIVPDGFLDPVHHGTGGPPDLIRTPSGFTLVHASGNALVIRDSDGFAWTPPAYVYSVSGAAPVSPELGRGHAPSPEDLYLAWCEAGAMVFLSRRIAGSWQPAEMAYSAPSWAMVNNPRVEAYTDNGYPRPRVYFAMDEGFDYQYVQEGGGGWSDTIRLHYSAFGMRLEVAADSDLLHVAAGLGPQPT